jgi:hypothetical protein
MNIIEQAIKPIESILDKWIESGFIWIVIGIIFVAGIYLTFF